jgi:hypothetical protein
VVDLFSTNKAERSNQKSKWKKNSLGLTSSFLNSPPRQISVSKIFLSIYIRIDYLVSLELRRKVEEKNISNVHIVSLRKEKRIVIEGVHTSFFDLFSRREKERDSHSFGQLIELLTLVKGRPR